MKKLMVILAMAVALAVMAVPALAWKEGPGTDWYFINANVVGGDWYSTAPPVIEIDGSSAAGQTFFVGDTINITCHVHAYAASCAGAGNEAYTNAGLQVTGPSGPGSDTAEYYDYSDYCAEVDTEATLSIAYTLTAAGTHQVYANSYAAVAQYWTDVDEEMVEASLTFEVVPAVIPVNIDIKPGSYPNCFNVNGHGVIPVAILGSADFDVAQIDVDTLSFGGLQVRVKGNDKPQCSVEDVSGDFTSPEGAPDGYDDLVCQFVDDADTWTAGDATATLTGALLDGTPIEGEDSICIRP